MPASDRNLLYGILALQMDFLSRDALIAGMSAWVLRKARPLGEILQEQGVLSAEHHGLLEAMVRAHLGAHGNDPGRSLAAVTAAGTVRQDLERVGDPDLRASLAHVAGQTTDGPEATGPFAVGTPSPGGRFTVLRPHARGGLGEVFVARDEELHRDVALKEIQARYTHDPASRARFLLEAEVTGGLEHPGVVPVYGLGVYPDGRPFYAMRFIQGDTLKEAVERFHAADGPGRDPGERTLALRELLGRFVAVCQAVAYAHSRGVIHRDLKPANVMLGRYGETLLVDWGLAKVVGRPEGETAPPEGTLRPSSGGSETPTQAGQALGTPVFMSPEQAAGQVDRVGPASDVYGLGAVLYCLLTGRAPFQGSDTGAVLRAVQRGDFPPPRQVNRSVPAALEAVCLRAMAPRPEGRYATAEEVADEVRRWLADEPVRAYREPARARAARWGRRHRPAVAAAAALLVTAVVALGVGLVAVKREQQETERQRQQADEQRRAAVAARRQADEQGRLAVETLGSVVSDIQTDLAEVPAAQRVRQGMLRKAVAGLRRVAASVAAAPEKDHSLVWAHLSLGDIFHNIGSTEPGGGQPEARKEYLAACAVAEQVAAADPDNMDAARDLAIARERLGEVLLDLGDVRGAREAFRKAHESARRLARADPGDADSQRGLAVSLAKLGDVLVRQGDVAGAREAYQEGLAVRQHLAETNPGRPEVQRDLVVAGTELGEALLRLGDLRGARDVLQEAMKRGEQLTQADPNSARAERDVLAAGDRLTYVLLQLRDAPGARELQERLLDGARRRATADPTSAQAQRDLSTAEERLGDILLEMNDAAGARDNYQSSVTICRRLADADRASADAQRSLAVAQARLGGALLRLGDARGARQAYQDSLDGFRRLAQADPEDAEAQRDAAEAHGDLGQALLQLGDVPAAREADQKALAIEQRLLKAHPENGLVRNDVVLTHANLGKCHQREFRFAEAAACYEQALAVARGSDPAGKATGPQEDANLLRQLEHDQATCRDADRAVAALDFALKQPPDQVPGLLDLRVRALCHAGKPGEAAATAEHGYRLAGKDAARLYDVACWYALCSSATPPANAERLAARAVAVLREAVEAGYRDADHLKADHDLDGLRGRDDYKKLVADLERRPSR